MILLIVAVIVFFQCRYVAREEIVQLTQVRVAKHPANIAAFCIIIVGMIISRMFITRDAQLRKLVVMFVV